LLWWLSAQYLSLRLELVLPLSLQLALVGSRSLQLALSFILRLKLWQSLAKRAG
jgi:hypothetical protein